MKKFLLILFTLLTVNAYSVCADFYIVSFNNRIQLVWANNNRPNGITYIRVYTGNSVSGPGFIMPGGNNSVAGFQGWLSSVGYSGINNSSIYIVAGNDTCRYKNQILPVGLTSFVAKTENEKINLEWTTAWEENNFGFFIEMKSELGEWEVVSFVKGRGTTNLPQTYSYTWIPNSYGTFYIRLRQVDLNGSYDLSDIAVVKIYPITDNKEYIYFRAWDGVWMRKEISK